MTIFSVEKAKAIIVGGHDQACDIFEYLIQHNLADIVLCIARRDDSGVDGVFPSLLKRARKYDIPTLQPEKLNSGRVLDSVARIQADIVLSLQNNMIFGDKWVELYRDRLGIVNVHYSPLPKYGGYWPEMWALWNQEKQFAVTMHYVEKGIDTGPIISQRWFDIHSEDNRKSLYEKSNAECFTMLVENLPKILKEKISAINQESSERTYFPKSLPNDGYLDLEWDVETQKRFIRAIAFPGFPGPKVKIGTTVYTLIAEDLEFFKKIKISGEDD